jgi:hypothetical protein
LFSATKEVDEVVFIWRMKKGSKNGKKKGEKEDPCLGKKYLNKVKCFKCHHLEHYARQCLEKENRKAKHVAIGVVVGVDEGSSQLETTFSMISYLSSNTMSIPKFECIHDFNKFILT